MGRAGVLPTLSLDFTAMGGTLNSLITFSRTSTATFINSLGNVEYAASNLLQNSEWADSNTTPTNWSLGGNAPTIPSTGSRTFTTTTAAISYIVNGGISLSQGVTYSAVIEVSNVVGSPIMINTIVATASPSNEKWYQDGVLASGSSQVITAGTITYTFTSGSGSNIRNGLGSTGGAVSNQSVTITRPRVVPGINIGATYYPSTTSAAYHAPRFDYDSALAAKGLLLEGPATNLLNWSETFATTGGTNNNWADTNLTRTSTNNTSPRNDATALRITASVLGNGTIISSAAIGTSASRVLSVWLRRVTGTGNIQYTLDNGATYTTQAITSSWVRYSFPATTAAQRVGFRIVTSLDAIEIWGAQLETEASTSYIPTGAGQVTRAADTAIIAAGSNFSSWYTGGTSGTFVANWYGSASTPTARSVVATNDQTTKHLHMYQTPSALTLRLADFPVTTVTTANSLTAGALTKGAFSYAASATSLCLNGGTVATGTLAFSAAPTWLSIGGPSNNGTSITDTTVMLNNSIRTLQYYPARLTDGQIQGLTA